MSDKKEYELDPRFEAGLDFLRRTRIAQIQVRWSDDKEPTVWFAVGRWKDNKYETAAALHPVTALLRLCEEIIDGAPCGRCGRPQGFDPVNVGVSIFDQVACWWQFDPELKVFRRGCG